RYGEWNRGELRGGRRRVGVRGEGHVDRALELGLDRGAGDLARERRQAILKPREIVGHLLAEEVGAGRERLPELDEARAEILKRRSEPLARPTRHVPPCQ